MTVAYFQMVDDGERPFVLCLEDDALIAHARQLVAGATSTRSHVQGTIVQTSADYNPGWSFHLEPASIKFFDVATEVCDAASIYVEEHLNEVGGEFLPKAHWCPRGSQLTTEVGLSGVALRAKACVPLKDAFDMYQKQSDSVHKLWGYLSVVSIAVLGFTIGSDKVNWTGPAYLFVAGAYLMFSCSNLWVLRRSQQELGSISKGLKASAAQTGAGASLFAVKSVKADCVTAFHAASILVVLGAIAFTWHQNCVLGTKCGVQATTPLPQAGGASSATATSSPARRQGH